MSQRVRSRKSARSSSSPRSSSRESSMRTGAAILSSLFVIAINAYLLNYVLKLEEINCECAKDWQHKYIKVFSSVVIAVSSLMILLNLTGVTMSGGVKSLFNVFMYFLSFASLINIFVLYNYSTGLVAKECECSAGNARTFMTYYSMVLLFLLLLMVGVSIIMGAVSAARR